LKKRSFKFLLISSFVIVLSNVISGTPAAFFFLNPSDQSAWCPDQPDPSHSASWTPTLEIFAPFAPDDVAAPPPPLNNPPILPFIPAFLDGAWRISSRFSFVQLTILIDASLC
jgi:hypothetical protein